jgi:hypothetical protein
MVEQSGGRLGDAEQVEAGGGDGSNSIGETNEGNVWRGHPELEIFGPEALQGGQGNYEVSDGAGPDDESSHRAQYGKNRNDMRCFIHSKSTGQGL